jgi:hypothetical protein
VAHGATQAQVQEALGQPKGQMSVGGMTTWIYERGQIEFKNGRAERVELRERTRQPEQRTTNTPAPAAYVGPVDARTREITRLTDQLFKARVNDRQAAAEKLKEMEKRQIVEARERSEKHRQAAIGLASLCLSGLLALLLVFRVQVLSEPPPLPLFSRVLCLASGLSLCVAVIMLLVSFVPSWLSGIHVDAWAMVFALCLCTSFTVMKMLRATWARADGALAGKTPRDACSRLSVNGFLFLALAICLGSVGYLHMLHWQIGMLTLTAAFVVPCLILSAVNLSQRSRIRATVQQFLQQDSDPEDIPERPMGVALFSILAMGTGLALITFGYCGITSVIPHMFRSSISDGLSLFVGGIAVLLGLTPLVAGESAYLLEESGRRLLVRVYWALCVGPLIPLGIVALIYLNRPAVKDKFCYDIKERDGWDIAQGLQNRYWRWITK